MTIADGPGCAVTVCRECVPVGRRRVDPGRQIERLRAAGHRARGSRCLDVCSQATVMVVHPAPAARRGGARPVWLGLVLDDDIVDDIAGWVAAGGPGVASLPAMLELCEIPPGVRKL
ncbi:hypothetical protein [Actinoplanes sp. NPDC051494]|uniref:hypothetical protein n=1 Tax=Actinoplanes sp. NPDC051494 TaxID=3363907 RepID=UPI00378EFA4F